MSSMIGRRYQLLRKLGAGAMGAVYECRDRLTRQTVALKRVLTPDQSTREAGVVDEDGEDGPIESDESDLTADLSKIISRSKAQSQLSKMQPVTGVRSLTMSHTIDLPLPGSGSQHLSAACNPLQMAQGPETSKVAKMALAREFRTMASLRHPSIVSVLDYGFDEDKAPFFTMELIESPRDIIKAGAECSFHEKILLLAQVLRALSYLHRRGILHRDLKPSNILCAGHNVKVLDFGIASGMNSADDIAGTIEYMAPELLLGSQPSQASDLYAFGVVAYELMHDSFPYSRATVSTMITQSLAQIQKVAAHNHAQRFLSLLNKPDSASAERLLSRPPEGDFSGPLGDILRKLLSPDPTNRYNDAATVLTDLAVTTDLELPLETAATRESFLQAARLVGRDNELAILSAALAKSADGSGSGFLIGGESGVGKSRLLDEIRTQALVSGAEVVRGQASNSASQAYELWRGILPLLCLEANVTEEEQAILSPLVPELSSLLERPSLPPPALDPQGLQLLQFSTVVEILRKQPRQTVLLFEDLHWSGAESLALLRTILANIDKLPVLILANYRDDESPSLPSELPQLSVMKLQRLGVQAIADLSELMLGSVGRSEQIVDLLVRETEGNSFFLVEVVRGLAEEAGGLDQVGLRTLPKTLFAGGVKKVLQRRLGRVPAHAQAGLELAAVAGRQIDTQVFRQLLPNIDDWLLDCSAVAVLEMYEQRWRFSHDKLRESLLDRIDGEYRKSLHLKIADAIEAAYVGADRETQIAALAFHCHEAGDFERSTYYALLAGTSAQRLCLFPEARRLFSQGLDDIAKLPSTPARLGRKADLLLRLVQVSVRVDLAERNLARLVEAEDALRALGDAVPHDQLQRAKAPFLTGRVHHYVGNPSAAIDAYQRASVIAMQSDNRPLLGLSRGMTGSALVTLGRAAEGEPLLRQGINLMDMKSEPIDWLFTCNYHAGALAATGRGFDSYQAIERGIKFARELNTVNAVLVTTMCACVPYMWMQDWPNLRKNGRDGVELAIPTNEVVYIYIGSSCAAWAEANLGNFDLAEDLRVKAREIAKSRGGRVGYTDWFESYDAMTAVLKGEYRNAIALASKRIEQSKPAGMMYSWAICERAIGLAKGYLGEKDSASNHLKESERIFRESGNHAELLHSLVWKAKLALHLDDHEVARRLLQDAVDGYERIAFSYSITEAKELLSRLSN